MKDTKYPANYEIDIAGLCNLRCKFCSEGKRINEQPQRFMSLEEFKKVTSSFLPYAKRISLTSWSESFLNKDVFKIIRYIKERSEEISVAMSTNGNRFSEEDAHNLVKLSPDYLVISLSGITNDIYRRYHVGGDINRVIKTLEYITSAKEYYKSAKPFIEIVYLMFPFNYILLGQLKRFLYKKIGPDRFRQINYIRLNYGYFCGSDLTLEQLAKTYGKDLNVYKHPIYLRQDCNRAHNNPAIRADGTLFPCCAITYNQKHACGNLKSDSFDKIWNSKDYQKFRKTFDERTNSLCESCTWYFPAHKIKLDRFLIHRIKGRLWLLKKHPFFHGRDKDSQEDS